MGWTRQEVLDVARSTGRPVVEAWSSHNAGQMGTVLGPMLHHTGSTWSYPTNTAPTLRTVREGRSDLQNALCMYYIDYEGVIYCITEKIAWHAGGGSWQGITDGNGHFAGIEAESDGVQWTKPTVASYKRLAAAILRKTGRTVAYAPLHKQYALPKGRKTDFSGMDPATFLADVNADLAGNPTSEGDELVMDAEARSAFDEVKRLLGNLNGYPERAANQYEVKAAEHLNDGIEARRMLGVLLGWNAPATANEAAALGALRGGSTPDVDEAALAAALAPLLTANLGKLSDADVERISVAVNDEQARRQAS